MSDTLIRVDAPDTLHGWALVVPGSPEHIRYTTSEPAEESAPAGGDLNLDPDTSEVGDDETDPQDQDPTGSEGSSETEVTTETTPPTAPKTPAKPATKPAAKPASKTASKGK